MVRALGLNTVSTYIFWNAIEPQPGQFDWTGQNDIAEFCRLAQKEGLKVIIRPGPYVCGEWDFGGLPWWLLRDPNQHVRTGTPAFLTATKRYFKALGEQLAPLQATRGGPIVMVQVENEYDGFGRDDGYIGALCTALRESGFEVPFYTSEMSWSLRRSSVPDLIRAVGFSDQPDKYFAELKRVQPDGPLFCGELYTGWFDVWARSGNSASSFERLTNTLDRVLNLGASFNLYMVHGGTSFGFTAGANTPPFRPQPTSYDYGAPIDEAGRPTPKYYAVREVIARHLPPGMTIPPVPPPNPVIALPEVTLRDVAPILKNLPDARTAQRPQMMEVLGQGHGCVVYRTKLPAGGTAELIVTEARDFAVVLLDGKRIGTLDRMRRDRSLWLPERKEESTLDLLVESMGHPNFGQQMAERKGITERVEIRDSFGLRELLNWKMYPLPLDNASLAGLKFGRGKTEGPSFYRGTFNLGNVGDTFLDLREWSKGVVWVNGHNLGRYWSVGPQQTLYLPGPWLKPRDNEIIILDLLGVERPTVAGLTNAILTSLNLTASGIIHRKPGQRLVLDGLNPTTNGSFAPEIGWQVVRFEPVKARYICLEARSSQANDGYATCAEINVVDASGKLIPRNAWKLIYADSEEVLAEDASADRILDGRPETFWHTRWDGAKEPLPHHIVIDLGKDYEVAGLRYLPRQDQINGRIGDYRIYTSVRGFPGL